MAIRKDPVVINMFVDIFVVILKENDDSVQNQGSHFSYVPSLFSSSFWGTWAVRGVHTCLLIFLYISLYLLLNTSVLKSSDLWLSIGLQLTDMSLSTWTKLF